MRFIRFLVLVLSTLYLTQIIANQNTYNFTKICVDNATDASANYTTREKSLIQSATALGSLGASVPLVIALERLPRKYIYLSAGVISAIATGLVPLAESAGFGYFFACRVFQGVGFSISFPMAGAVTSEWAGLKEHGIFLSFLTGFSQLANIYLMPVAGELCSSSWGWRSVYYVMTAVGAVLIVLLFLFFEDKPAQHRMVRPAELEHILHGRVEKKREPVPYMSVFKSLTIWGVWFSGFADILAIQFAVMFSPQYLNDYLHFDVLNTGFMSAVPIIVQWIFKVFAGVSSDLIKNVDETLKLRVYNTIALGLAAVSYIALSFVPNSQPALCMVVLILTEGFMGFNTAGFNKCGTLHARQHAHFIMMQIMNVQSICILVEPFLVNGIITDNTQRIRTRHRAAQWREVFWIHAVLMLGAAMVFLIFADARPAPWTESTGEVEELEDVKDRKRAYSNTVSELDIPTKL